MADATYEFLVDWNNDDDFGDANEDITSYVLDCNGPRFGRDFASQLVGRSRAGLCTLEVKNTDGIFNSFNTSSPLYGDLVAGRKFKITMDVGGSKSTLWQGFIDSIKPRPSRTGVQRATIRVVGPMERMVDRRVNVPMQTSITTGDAINDILDEIGWPGGDRDIDTGQTTMTRWWTGGKVSALFAARQLEDTEFGFFRETKDGKIAFEDRHHRLKDPHLTSQVTFSDALGAALTYYDVEQEDPLKQIYNIVEVDVRLYSVGSLAVLWTLDSNEVPSIGPGDDLEIWAEYPNPASATEAEAVDAWTTPVATTDYTANSASDGSGTDLTSDIGVAVSKFDTAMKITLTNNGSQVAYITLLQARGTPVNASDPIPIKREDATSQAAYGERTYPSDARFIPTTAEARDFCDFVLAVYGDIIPVIGISFLANRDANHLNQARLRDLSDRITITGTAGSELGVNNEFFIEAIKHRIRNAGLEHRCTLYCSPAQFFGGFWIWDTSRWGTDTKWAY